MRAAAAAKKGAKPPPAKPVAAAAQPTKTLADYKADVDNATDADTATLALDEARDVLDSTDNAELVEHWRKAWGQA